MIGLRVISWGLLFFCIGYWMLADNNGEMFLGGISTVTLFAVVYRLHPQPLNRLMRWLGIIE